MRVASVQLVLSDRPEENLSLGFGLAHEAALAGAELVLLPELFCVPVEASPEEVCACAQNVDGWLTRMAIELARSAGIVLAFGYPENDAGVLRSSLVAVGPRGVLSNARKVNLFGWDNLWALSAEPCDPRSFSMPALRVSSLVGRDVMNRAPVHDRPLVERGSTDLVLLPCRWVGPYSFPDSAWIDLSTTLGAHVVVSNIVGGGTYVHHPGGACIIEHGGARIWTEGLIQGESCFIMGDV